MKFFPMNRRLVVKPFAREEKEEEKPLVELPVDFEHGLDENLWVVVSEAVDCEVRRWSKRDIILVNDVAVETDVIDGETIYTVNEMAVKGVVEMDK